MTPRRVFTQKVKISPNAEFGPTSKFLFLFVFWENVTYLIATLLDQQQRALFGLFGRFQLLLLLPLVCLMPDITTTTTTWIYIAAFTKPKDALQTRP